MNLEEQLREALQDEGRAIGSAGSDLAAVRGRGRRRRAWKAAGAAFVTVLVVGGASAGFTALTNSGAEAPVAGTTVAPTMTRAPVTTPAPAPTAAPTTTEAVVTTTFPAAEGPPVVVAVARTTGESPDGLVTIDATGEPTPVFEGRFQALESDGRGGLVFQAQVAVEDSNRERASIYHVLAGTTQPVAVVTQDEGHIISMRTVAFIDGVSTLIYTDSFGFDEPETARQVLVAHDLDYSSMPREIAVVGGWESGVASVSVGGGVFLLDSYAESERSWRFVDMDGNEIAAPFNPLARCEAGDVRCPSAATMAPDGRLVYAQSVFFDPEGAELDLSAGDYVAITDEGILTFQGGEQTVIEEFVERVEIVIVDLETGVDRLLVSLFRERSEGEDGGAFFGLDFDGRYLIVSDRKSVPTPPAFVVDTEQPEFRWGLDVGGIASFPLALFDLPGVVQSPIGD